MLTSHLTHKAFWLYTRQSSYYGNQIAGKHTFSISPGLTQNIFLGIEIYAQPLY